MNNPLINPGIGTFVWMLVSFGILAFILIKWGWPMMLKSLKAREEAIQAEEAALARHVAKVKSVRTSKLDRAVRALEMAERNEREAGERFEEARRFYKEARSAGLVSEERISRLRRDADAAEEALDAAKTARKEAGRARDEAQDRLDRAEKDATKAFDDNLRAKGGKPVRPSASGGFFSWF